MYTFEDWLNDKIIEQKQMPEVYFDNVNICTYLLRKNRITKEVAAEINKAQEDAFDKAEEMRLALYKHDLIREIQKRQKEDGEEYIEFERKRVNKEIELNSTTYQENIGIKKFQNLTGSTTIRINDLYKLYETNGILCEFSLGLSKSDQVNCQMRFLKSIGAYLNQFGKIGTHRQMAIIAYFKATTDAGAFETREDVRKAGGKNREIAHDTVNYWTKSNTAKEITKKEIESILPYLQDFPKALQLAKDKLKQL